MRVCDSKETFAAHDVRGASCRADGLADWEHLNRVARTPNCDQGALGVVWVCGARADTRK
jgi:hypothetical protein